MPKPHILPSGLSIQGVSRPKRVPRTPKHTFNIVQYPYELTPFMIAPVLPGETMKNLLLQCRTISTAVKTPLIGHWLEHYFFYVKLRQLDDGADLKAMLLDSDNTPATDTAAADSQYLYVKSGAPDFMQMCLDKVTEHWFRDDLDVSNAYSPVGATTGLPIVQWENIKKSVFNSLIKDNTLQQGTGDITGTAQDLSEFERLYQSWEYMRMAQMTDLSYEDWLATFGVKTEATEKPDEPELIRFTRNWSYPTNTVDGSGNVNTQMSWSIQERADKDRFFKEPGFLIGLTVARPKVYLSTQNQSAVSLLNHAFSWMPALMKDNPETSLRKILTTDTDISPLALGATGDVILNTDEYWLDVRDLYVYGDQFINHTGNHNAVKSTNIDSNLGKNYPDATTLQAIGVGNTLSYSSDGIVSLNILGTQMDVT